MDRIDKQFVDVGYFDEDSIDCSRTPSSAEEYLKQVVAGRSRLPDYVVSPLAKSFERKVVTRTVEEKAQDPRAATSKWIQDKCAEFATMREAIENIPVTKLTSKILSIKSEETWHDLILQECHPDFVMLKDKFPNQIATPPALRLIMNLNQPQIQILIESIAEWAENEGFSRPLREWLFSLMLRVDLPLLHDVVAALRSLAKMCRQLRANMASENNEDILEMSLLIAIISTFFGQKDLSD